MNSSIDSTEIPALPLKHSSMRSNMTPSPASYDELPAPVPRRPPSQTSNQSGSQPGTPSPGYGLVHPFSQPYAGQAGSQPNSLAGSRASTPTTPHGIIQPYPHPYSEKPPTTPSGIQPTMQPPVQAYGFGQSAGQAYPGPPAGVQMKLQKEKEPPPKGCAKIIRSWVILSVVTIFINPVFGFIALGFSSEYARNTVSYNQRKIYGNFIIGLNYKCILVIFFNQIETHKK